jgi:hypothetical protein
VTISAMRENIRSSFRRHSSVKDPRTTDILRHKGEQVLSPFLLQLATLLSSDILG